MLEEVGAHTMCPDIETIELQSGDQILMMNIYPKNEDVALDDFFLGTAYLTRTFNPEEYQSQGYQSLVHTEDEWIQLDLTKRFARGIVISQPEVKFYSN